MTPRVPDDDLKILLLLAAVMLAVVYASMKLLDWHRASAAVMAVEGADWKFGDSPGNILIHGGVKPYTEILRLEMDGIITRMNPEACREKDCDSETWNKGGYTEWLCALCRVMQKCEKWRAIPRAALAKGEGR